MFIRSILSVMIVTSVFTLVFGQTPQKKADEDSTSKNFSFFFDGSGSYLGVQTSEINKDNFSKLRLKEVRGVAVDKVMDNSPAAAAGIQAGDVIVRFNGEEVTSSRKLTRLIGEVDPDHQARITVIRDGSERELTATLAKRTGVQLGDGKFDMPNGNWNLNMPDFKGQWPDNMPQFKGNWQNMMPDLKDLPNLKNLPQMKDLPDLKDLPNGDFDFKLPNGEMKGFVWRAGEGRQIGVGITPLTKQLATHFGVQGGAMINEVRENSPAARAGLQAGDIIVEANGKTIDSEMDVITTINNKKTGDVQLTIIRDGKRQTISVTPEASKDGGFFYKSN